MTNPDPATGRWLIVHKKSRYQQLVLEKHDEHVASLIQNRDLSVAQFERAHNAHQKSLELVHQALLDLGIDHDVKSRELVGDHISEYAMIVTVGGDGTVLDVSHKTATTPILGVNSDPQTSIGYFCAGDATEFPTLAQQTLENSWQPNTLHRFAVQIDDHLVTHPVLNDVLVCHQNPAAVSSYVLCVDEYAEPQRSSGVWISTPAGSTAAIRSAGGYIMPLHTNQFQYLVREPYRPKDRDYRLVKGIHSLDTHLEIISKMTDGCIYLDGPHIQYPFAIGSRLKIDNNAPPLHIYGVDESRRFF